MLEPTEMIEVKQGPYMGDEDKTRFEPVEEKKFVIENPQPESLEIDDPW